MTTLESASLTLAYLDARMRAIPGRTGGWDSDFYLTAAAAFEAAAFALEQQAEQPAPHGQPCHTLLRSIAQQCRQRAALAQSLAPVFAVPTADGPPRAIAWLR